MNAQDERSNAVEALVRIDLPELVSTVRHHATGVYDLPFPESDVRWHRVSLPDLEISLSCVSTPAVDLQLIRRLETAIPMRSARLEPVGRPPLSVTMRKLDRDIYQVLIAPPHGTGRVVEMEIPLGLARTINVATLKAMFGAGSRDVVFRKGAKEQSWTVCADSDPVDLEDKTQIYKVREFAIFS